MHQVVRREARAAVAHLHPRPGPRRSVADAADREHERRARRQHAQRVVGERVDHLAHPLPVGPGENGFAGLLHHEPRAGGVRPWRPGGGRGPHDRADVDDPRLQVEVVRLQPGQGHEVVDPALQARGLRPDHLAGAWHLGRREDAVGQRLRVTGDGRQRGPQLVRDGQQEPALPFLRLREPTGEGVQRRADFCDLPGPGTAHRRRLARPR